jgi:hypothetical protein
MFLRWARFAIMATKRMVGLLLLLAVLVSQSVMYAEATPDNGAHDQHQMHAAHQADCPMTSSNMSAKTPGDLCPDHAAMAHCSIATCCFHCADGLAKALFDGVLMSERYGLKDDSAAFSRASSPQDRPPRLV